MRVLQNYAIYVFFWKSILKVWISGSNGPWFFYILCGYIYLVSSCCLGSYLGVSKTPTFSAFLKLWFCFIPWRDSAKQNPRGPFDVFPFYYCVEKGVWHFQFTILRRDSAKQIPKEVQLFLHMSYFGLGNVYWTFNLHAVFCLFETLKMFYPPEGLCASIVPKVVQLFFTYILLM